MTKINNQYEINIKKVDIQNQKMLEQMKIEHEKVAYAHDTEKRKFNIYSKNKLR